MKNRKSYRRALLPFYLMVVYVLLQFFWWAYLILDQTKVIYTEPAELRRRWIMIGGEGSVFLTLMFIGIYRVQRAFRKEGELLARQKAFLHSITHEFKSPIASLRLQLETLLTRNLTGEQQAAALNNALEDTDRLDQVLEKILLSARIDNGELPLHPVSTDLSARLKDSIDKVSRAYPGRLIEQKLESGITSIADLWAFQSIAANLIENALLYSPAGSAVQVELAKSNGMAIMSVKDKGMGVPPGEREKIFGKFYRLNQSGGYKGTGLGLYLTAYLVNKLGGAVTVKDNIPQGSIFEVAIPCK
jgi:signal transduction histidine kinase